MSGHAYSLGSIRLDDSNQNEVISLNELRSGEDKAYDLETGYVLTVSQVQERLKNEFGITEFESFTTNSSSKSVRSVQAFLVPGFLKTPTRAPMSAWKVPGAAAALALVAAGAWMLWPGREDQASPDADVTPIELGDFEIKSWLCCQYNDDDDALEDPEEKRQNEGQQKPVERQPQPEVMPGRRRGPSPPTSE